VALALQRSILGPTDLPPGFAVRYEPAGTLEVGGDWYDVVVFPDGRYGLVVGDVVGRGLLAATVMGQLRSAGRALLLENNTPAHVLDALDRFARLIPEAFFTTVFCAVVDPFSHTMRYSSAGHVPAILVHADGTHQLLEDAKALPLATVKGPDRPEATVDLTPGSTLMLYTDGLVERRGDYSLDTGIDRATTVLVATNDLAPEEVADQLLGKLLDDDHDDDVAFLIYRTP
jgi:serine phosphatase RsbU (regulator of sigma subunit)